MQIYFNETSFVHNFVVIHLYRIVQKEVYTFKNLFYKNY
jgi:hypothetical protein